MCVGVETDDTERLLTMRRLDVWMAKAGIDAKSWRAAQKRRAQIEGGGPAAHGEAGPPRSADLGAPTRKPGEGHGRAIKTGVGRARGDEPGPGGIAGETFPHEGNKTHMRPALPASRRRPRATAPQGHIAVPALGLRLVTVDGMRVDHAALAAGTARIPTREAQSRIRS